MARPTQPALIRLPRKKDFITDGMSDADARAAHKRFLAAMAAYKENKAARAEWMKTHATEEERAEREKAKETHRELLKPFGKLTSEGDKSPEDILKEQRDAEKKKERAKLLAADPHLPGGKESEETDESGS